MGPFDVEEIRDGEGEVWAWLVSHECAVLLVDPRTSTSQALVDVPVTT